jgi:phthalate 4,5-cis-dihydrodiol dehydrogenase
MVNTLRVGIAGLGIASRQVFPAFKRVPNVILTAVADIRTEALDEYRQLAEVETFTSVQAMCESDAIDAVWIATPNPLHAEHTVLAARNGKHVICEKPMATSLDECQAMIEVIDKHNVKYVQGHSKAYDPPVRRIREIVSSGAMGRLIQVNTWMYKGWLLRPRLASEVDTDLGGGVCFRQGPHHADIVRCIGGGMVRTVRSITGRWNPHFDTEGNYTAFLEFEDGTPATMVFNGYGYFDITELTWGITEGGGLKSDPDPRGEHVRRPGPIAPEEKYSLSSYRVSQFEEQAARAHKFQPIYGLTIVSCERGDIRQSPDGLYLYTDEGKTEVPCDTGGGHANELQELYDAVTQQRPAFPDARWGMANLELCIALMESSQQRREVTLAHQVPCPI